MKVFNILMNEVSSAVRAKNEIPSRRFNQFFYTVPDASIDYVNHYRLVDHKNVDIYARAFIVEDEDQNFVLNAEVNTNIKNTSI